MTLDGVMQAPGGPEEDPTESFRFGGWQAPYDDSLVGEVTKKSWNNQSSIYWAGKRLRFGLTIGLSTQISGRASTMA